MDFFFICFFKAIFIILAHILIRLVEEFKGMDADMVASLIEGEPYISQVPASTISLFVSPGSTGT